MKYRPRLTKGWRAWTWGEMRAFEERRPICSTRRLCYGLALWLRPRRRDGATLSVASIEGDSITFTTHKTASSRQYHADASRDSGRHRSIRPNDPQDGPRTSLQREVAKAGRMADWTRAAGLPKAARSID